MAHFAELDNNNNVIRVIVVHNNELLDNGVELETKGIAFCKSLFGGNWIQTSFNNRMRKQFAGPGYKYNIDADVFIAPQPYSSWSLDNDFNWQAPIKKPEGDWSWDEEIGNWVEALAM